MLRAHALPLIVVFLAAAACKTESSSNTPLSKLEADTGVAWISANGGSFGVPVVLVPKGDPGIHLGHGVPPQSLGSNFLDKYGGIFGVTSPGSELQFDSLRGPDNLGIVSVSFAQAEKGVPVFGAQLSLEFDSAGVLRVVSGIFVPGLINFDIQPTKTPEEALLVASADFSSRLAIDASKIASATPVLVIDPQLAPPSLTYRIGLWAPTAIPDATAAAAPGSGVDYIIDAKSGAILLARDSSLDLVPVTATGTNYEGSSVSFPAAASAAPSVAPYYMRTLGPEPASIIMQGTPNGAVISSNALSSWDTGAVDPGSAIDAFLNLGIVAQYWHERGRNSFDDDGGSLVVQMRDPGLTYSPARWDRLAHVLRLSPSGPNALYGVTFLPAAISLDALGHEYQHAVNSYAIGLNYVVSETAAVEESLCDVFGQFVEHEFEPTMNEPSLAAEAIYPPTGIRNLQHPGLSLLPSVSNVTDPSFATATYSGDAEAFYKVVRTDIGIPNNAWYLATFGGANDWSNIEVPGDAVLGWDDSENIYRSVASSSVLPRSTNLYFFASALSAQAIAGFGLNSSQLTAIACAWYAVGVLDQKFLRDIEVDECLPPDAGRPVQAEAGTSPESDAAPAYGRIDVCSIASSLNVAALIGFSSTLTYQPPTSADPTDCNFVGQTTSVNQDVAIGFGYPASAALLESHRQEQGGTVLPGVGDGAFYVDQGRTYVQVLKDDNTFDIQLSGSVANAVALADAIVAKMP